MNDSLVPLQLASRQLNNEARIFKASPKILNLRVSFSSSGLTQSIRKGGFAGLTVIETIGDVQERQVNNALVLSYCFSRTLVAARAAAAARDRPSVSQAEALYSVKDWARDMFADLQILRVYGVADCQITRSRKTKTWKDLFGRQELEVVFI